MAQNVPFWNNDLAQIASESSRDGWIRLKTNLNIKQDELFVKYKSAFALQKDDEIKQMHSNEDLLGNKHYVYQQFYNGIPA